MREALVLHASLPTRNGSSGDWARGQKYRLWVSITRQGCFVFYKQRLDENSVSRLKLKVEKRKKSQF